MRSSLKVSLPILFLLAFCVSIQDFDVAHACSCVYARPSYELYQQADAVFAGKVVSVGTTSSGWSNAPITITLEVFRVWKGPGSTVLVVTTAQSGASCGFSFQKGVDYLVYAKNYDGQLSTGLCSGTKLLSVAQGDMFWLDFQTGFLHDFLISLAGSAVIVILASIWFLRRRNAKLSKTIRAEIE